jgi:DNA gyrase/topoisomerase IV subunit B
MPQVTGGRNGYGAKLANIFSTEFTIETCDGKGQYKQVRAMLGYCRAHSQAD